MNDTHRYSVSAAAAVVRNDGKVLAIRRRDNGHWEPPGGVVEPGERITDALVREVREETGLVVEPGVLTGVYQNMERDIVALVFRCSVSGPQEVHPTPETSQVRWLPDFELSELMDEAYSARILDALADARKPALRFHNGRDVLG